MDVLKRVISHNEIEKGCGKCCDIRLISSNHVNRYTDAIEKCEEISIVKNNENKFTIIYKSKKENKLAKLSVNDFE
ncbi:unnamed protein product [Rotaria sp. Silwood2]|nr:unnamed protein product [Rotaria sp. Silwood2]